MRLYKNVRNKMLVTVYTAILQNFEMLRHLSIYRVIPFLRIVFLSHLKIILLCDRFVVLPSPIQLPVIAFDACVFCSKRIESFQSVKHSQYDIVVNSNHFSAIRILCSKCTHAVARTFYSESFSRLF